MPFYVSGCLYNCPNYPCYKGLIRLLLLVLGSPVGVTRAFLVAAPHLWKNIPFEIAAASPSVNIFQNFIKDKPIFTVANHISSAMSTAEEWRNTNLTIDWLVNLLCTKITIYDYRKAVPSKPHILRIAYAQATLCAAWTSAVWCKVIDGGQNSMNTQSN